LEGAGTPAMVKSTLHAVVVFFCFFEENISKKTPRKAQKSVFFLLQSRLV
jgi:hypothetical protein